MIDVLKRNQGKSKNARQYNDAIRLFSTYIFLLCGRTCYETLSKSLPMPSTKTICKILFDYQMNCASNNNNFKLFSNTVRYINESKNRVVEGKLRCQELLEYLNERKAGADVWLSEDASGIIEKIQYDPSSNQLIGMTLPFDDQTGCPKLYESTAQDVEEIKKFMQHNRSCLVYIVMATPLKEGIPPFLLQMYGTDNRFNTGNVVKRWDYTIEELKRYLIKKY